MYKVIISNYPEIKNLSFIPIQLRSETTFSIQAASSRDLTKNMIRVRSSNVWAYSYNPRDNSKGDIYAQFHGKPGRPGDIYVYYDVPARVYTKWLTAGSKGKYFWKYIRNRYKYAKLTGDKRTKLKNGVNSAADIKEAIENKIEQNQQISYSTTPRPKYHKHRSKHHTRK